MLLLFRDWAFLGIKPYNWWNEGLHGLARSGVATMFPQAIGMAAMFDTELVEKAGDITSTEARAKYNVYTKYDDRDIYKGLTLWAPNINIFRDPRWGRGHETYGEDPFLTAENGKAYVRGLQGDGEVMKTAACAKHFAVHSGPESIRHEFNAEATQKDMEETYLPAFEALVKEAKVESVMGAYNRVNGEGACASKFLMGKLSEWGFDGYFVSDCWAIRDFHEHHGLTKNAVESAALALTAGCDVNCGCTYVNVLAALDEGLVTKEDIRKACVHLMRTRIRLGMFDDKTEFDDIPYNIVSCVEHKKVSLECAEKSMVLLKNNGILPLDKNKVNTIAVIGPNSNSRIVLEGNYNGTADRYITFLEGIQDRFEGRVIYAEGCHLYKQKVSGLAMPGDRYAEAMAAAENADVVILCVGLDSTIEGEEGDTGNEFSSGDKNDIRLPESQRILVDKIMKTGKPVVVVCAAGSAVNTECAPDALIHAWYPGSEGGTALAEILFGDVSPSGKLPVTFYEKSELLPEFTDYSMKNRTYRFAENNVLYPFGFGLSYTSFEQGKTSADRMEIEAGGQLRIKTSVKNTGKFAGGQTIQVYVKALRDNTPNAQLKGLKKLSLQPGEAKEVEIVLTDKAFALYDEDAHFMLEEGDYEVSVGMQQPDRRSSELTGQTCSVLKVHCSETKEL